MGSDSPHHQSLPPGVTAALLTAFALPEEGGIQRSVHQVASGFGSQALVVAPPHTGDVAFDRVQPYHVLRRDIFGGRGKPSWAWLGPWIIQQRRAGLRTVIFGHYSSACLIAPLIRVLGMQYVVLVHGRDLLTERRRSTGILMSWILRQAAWIGVNSTFVGALVQNDGVPWTRIVRTHPAVPDHALTTVTAPIPNRMITVARLVARKNIDGVLRAVKIVRAKFPTIHYDIVGDGPERIALEKACHELGLEQHVTFHGQITDDQRDALLHQAAAFVMVPKVGEQGADVEGLGLVYLEAAAAGRPIIASNTGGVADIVKYGANGYLVDPNTEQGIAENLQRIFSQPWDTETLAQRALVECEFTWSVRNSRVQLMFGNQKPQVDIGVVIPAYNAADTIGGTLTSLFGQSLLPEQVVIVDDGSTDDLRTAIQPWADRIQLIHQENAGAAVARNVGAQQIQLPYIIFLDADITLRPSALAEMARALVTHPEAAYAYPSFTFGPKAFRLFDFDAARLQRMNYIHTSALIRKSEFPGFDPALKKFQDWDLWLTMLAQKKVGIWTGTNLFSVRQRAIGYSTWLPKIVYRLPYIGRGRGSSTIASYRTAETIIRTKHHLPPVA